MIILWKSVRREARKLRISFGRISSNVQILKMFHSALNLKPTERRWSDGKKRSKQLIKYVINGFQAGVSAVSKTK